MVRRYVSVLLKTSRGLKPEVEDVDQSIDLGFSALEDEPWIEADNAIRVATDRHSFSALEDEPWIEAVPSTVQHSGIYRFQCS